MIKELLLNKTSTEKSQIKSLEIAKLNHVGEYTKGDVKVEIQSLKAIEVNGQSGVEVTARAWKETKQLGFGDGSVEIERFRIFNPPILVPDINGDFVKNCPQPDGTTKQTRYREDLIEAIRQSLAHTVGLVGKENTEIIKGKVGNTTSTFNTDGTDGKIDGFIQIDNQATWAGARDAATGDSATRDNGSVWVLAEYLDPQLYRIYRGFTLFDTSSIPDTDNISSATLSFTANGRNDGYSQSVHAVKTNPASTSTLAAADFDQVGGFTSGGSKLDSGWTIDNVTYGDITLTDLTWISKTGITKLGVIQSLDQTNTTPGTQGTRGYIVFNDNTTTGTTADPKLTVVHGVAAATNHWLLTGV